MSGTNCWPRRRLHLKCDGTRAETIFRLSAKRTCPFKSAGASVHSTTGSRDVHITFQLASNPGYTMFRGSVKGTGYPLHSPVSPSIPLPCFTVCNHISTGLYYRRLQEESYSDRLPCIKWSQLNAELGTAFAGLSKVHSDKLILVVHLA